MDEKSKHSRCILDRDVLSEIAENNILHKQQLVDDLRNYLNEKLGPNEPAIIREDNSLRTWLKGERGIKYFVGKHIKDWCLNNGCEVNLLEKRNKKQLKPIYPMSVQAQLQKLLNMEAYLVSSSSKNRINAHQFIEARVFISLYPGRYRKVFKDGDNKPVFTALIEPEMADVTITTKISITNKQLEGDNEYVYSMGDNTPEQYRFSHRVTNWNVSFHSSDRKRYRDMELVDLMGELSFDDIIEVRLDADYLNVKTIEVTPEYNFEKNSFEGNSDIISLKQAAVRNVMEAAFYRTLENNINDVVIRAPLVKESENV